MSKKLSKKRTLNLLKEAVKGWDWNYSEYADGYTDALNEIIDIIKEGYLDAK